ALTAAALDVHPVVAAAALVAALGATGFLVRGRARRRPDLANSLLQSMNEAVMVLDANYRVIDVNRRWRELTGHGADEPIRFDPPPMPPASGGDWLLPRADGTEVPVLATLAPIAGANGETRGYVATYVDIADRKRAEEALAERADELERGNARLAAALAFKNDLTSRLTHDVAQPVSSIASLSELLCADWADLPDDIRFELASKIDKNTHRLIKMMSDLQLLFRLDPAAMSARRSPVPLTLDPVDGVEIDIDENLSVLADREHVTAVLHNLVKNALEHGEPPVVVTAARRGETVVLTVQDNGPGIPEESLPNLFGRFTRGPGLGLFIVRHLVEANGGSVRYEQVRPRGARVVVTWEAAPV
ncbi:PAS domain-containing sensor histidine kinase, partial [Actinoplanes sp. NPDC051411]|uniref:PAS domain-containing sensor histidine kinase n=1 Tax=Actinoplanes sp. NPDC051411 TaxID=3155522 RepID=UPI003417393B